MIQSSKSIPLSKFLLCLLIISSLIPDIGKSINTAGFYWTFYRIVVVLASLYFLVINHFIIRINLQKLTGRWIAFLDIWILYGFAILVISNYSDVHNGMLEILSILLGMLTIWNIHILELGTEEIKRIKKLIYWIITFLAIIGIGEIITGHHFAMSSYNTMNAMPYIVDTHQATGFMYNVNDFSALLTCFVPIIFSKVNGKKRWLTICGIIAINLVNDATICNSAIIIFFLYYYLLVKDFNGSRELIKRLVFILLCIIAIFIIYFAGPLLMNRSDIIGAIARQIYYARRSSGSMFSRLLIYKDGILAWLHGNFLGLGPSSFTNFFIVHKSNSRLVNPHSLFIEILVQYGIFIFIGYISLLITMIKRARSVYLPIVNQNDKEEFAEIIGSIIVYILVSFAPSTFLGYAYQWLALGLISCQIDERNRSGGYNA